MKVYEVKERDRWNEGLRRLPGAHVLQTWEWGEFKRATGGWQPLRLAFERDGQVVAQASLATKTLGPLKVMVVSKGPALDYADGDLVGAVLDELERRARRFGVVWLKIDPDVIAATGLPGSEDDRAEDNGQEIMARLRARDWRFSDSQVQFRNTLCIDLRRSEDELLADDERQYAPQSAGRHEERRDDSPGNGGRPAAALSALSSHRPARRLPDSSYRVLSASLAAFMEAGLAHALIAEYRGVAIAQVILFHFGSKCWYFYGASADEERAAHAQLRFCSGRR